MAAKIFSRKNHTASGDKEGEKHSKAVNKCCFFNMKEAAYNMKELTYMGKKPAN